MAILEDKEDKGTNRARITELILGPNGALIFCMEYLLQNMDWLHEQMDEVDDDYYLFDCPGAFAKSLFPISGIISFFLQNFISFIYFYNFRAN